VDLGWEPGRARGRVISRDESIEHAIDAFISKRYEQRVRVQKRGAAGRRRGVEGPRTPSGSQTAGEVWGSGPADDVQAPGGCLRETLGRVRA
jgi:hypothetical protein